MLAGILLTCEVCPKISCTGFEIQIVHILLFLESPKFFECVRKILRKGSIENYVHMHPVKQSPFFQEEKLELYSII